MPIHREWRASYSTQKYPLGEEEFSNEIIRLCRSVESTVDRDCWEFYLGIGYDVRPFHATWYVITGIRDPKGKPSRRGRKQLEQVKKIRSLTRATKGAVPETGLDISQEHLLELTRNFMDMMTIAREEFAPVRSFLPSLLYDARECLTNKLHSKKSKNEIWGVGHGFPQFDYLELEEVKRRIHTHSPKKVGLEIPKYQQMWQALTHCSYFTKIAEYLDCKEIEFIPLEDNDLWAESKGIAGALNILKNEVTKEEVKNRLREYEKRSLLFEHMDPLFASPEVAIALEESACCIKSYKKALSLLDSNLGLEKIEKMFTDSNREREKFQLRAIQEQNPDLVIVGDGHATELSKSLPNYDYYSFCNKG